MVSPIGLGLAVFSGQASELLQYRGILGCPCCQKGWEPEGSRWRTRPSSGVSRQSTSQSALFCSLYISGSVCQEFGQDFVLVLCVLDVLLEESEQFTMILVWFFLRMALPRIQEKLIISTSSSLTWIKALLSSSWVVATAMSPFVGRATRSSAVHWT